MTDQRCGSGWSRGWAVGLTWALLISVSMARADGDDARPETALDVPESANAFQPVAPELPAEVVAALQEARYGEAIESLVALSDKVDAAPEARSYYALLRGIAHRLAGELDQSTEVLASALTASPDGPWAAKIRGELAVVHLAAGRFAEAEALARAEAEALLDDVRKDRLAGIYQSLARRLLEPTEAVTPPDPEGAHALLEQARRLAQGDVVRAELLLAMAEASRKAGSLDRAVGEYQRYLTEYDTKPVLEGAAREGIDRARFGLGESQLALGQNLPARLTWESLVRDRAAEARSADLRARALYEIARTYGVPSPPDPQSLSLGIGALKRFLDSYPAHPLAVRAAFEIGETYLNQGRSQEALDAFQAFLAGGAYRAGTGAARAELAERAQEAAFRVGQILVSQASLDDAIAAFQGYLAQHPNGPHSADAQRAILDARVQIADRLAAREQFAEARTSWLQFVGQNPLDARVPELLFRVGRSYLDEEPRRVEEAIEAWQTLIGKFPGTEPAAHAQFEIARLLESDKKDPKGAIERYRKVDLDPWQSQARERIVVMESKSLVVVTPRAFRSGDTPTLEVSTRNLKSLTFSAYKLNPEAYFRKKLRLGDVESLDIGLVAPDAEWTLEVPGYADFTPIESTFDLQVELPGVYVVKVSDEDNLQATTLVVGSDLEAIVKVSADQVLVFAQDMKTGQGRPNVRVLVAQGDTIRLDATTGDDGVLLTSWGKDEPPPANSTSLSYLVLDGPHTAGNALGQWLASVAQGLSPRAYLHTDRPAYRPGQRVELRGIVREVQDGRYAFDAGRTYKLEVADSRGRPFLSRDVTLSDFGTFDLSIDLDSAASVGSYNIRLYRPGGSEFSGSFQVQSYQLEKVELEFDLPRTVYYRGETIEGAAVARYQYGTPLVGRPIELVLPDGRTLTGTTDEAGRYVFEVETEGYAQSRSLQIVARLPMDNVAVTGQVAVAVQGFDIGLSTSRDVYLDDESFALDITTTDALGAPVGQDLTVRVLRIGEIPTPTSRGNGFQSMPLQGGRGVSRIAAPVDASGEAVAYETTTRTDAQTGKVTITLRIDDDQGGRYLIRATGTDQFGNPIVTDRSVVISGAEDENRLRLLADTTRHRVGDTATIRLHSRLPEGLALLAWEADRILKYKLVSVREGDNTVTWDVDDDQFPNFTLTAQRMHENQLAQARLDLSVEQDLRVTITSAKANVGPGEEFVVEVETRDQQGNPVSAETSLTLVDRALLRLFPDPLPPITSFFYDQNRRGAFVTEATNTFFPYKPPTVRVPQAIVDERLRSDARLADLGQIDVARRQAASELQFGMPMLQDGASMMERMDSLQSDRPSVMDSRGLPAAPGMGGGMGGMGGYGGMMGGRGEFDQRTALGMSGGEIMMGEAESEYFGKRGAFGFDGRFVDDFAAASTRQSFVETAYWNPQIVTGADGKATVTVKAPTALSRYEFLARGVTGSQTLVGQATAEVQVRKDFFVELKVPAILTEGDAPRFEAELHHQGAKGTVVVVLKAYAGDRERTFRREVDVDDDGVSLVRFDPFSVPNGDVVRLDVSATLGGSTDALTAEIPIRPWGIQAYATASGSSSDGTTAFVSLPEGRRYSDPRMVIVLSPSVRRLLVELALGQDVYPLARHQQFCFPRPPDTIIDRASDLLGAASALEYLRSLGTVEVPEAERLRARIRGLIAELLTLQNDDGGWPWVAGAQPQSQKPASDRTTSAHVTWALAASDGLVTLPDPNVLDRATNYLAQQFAQAESGDTNARAALLHALSTRNRATFEQANALNRIRQNLSDSALAYLSLTFANLNRPGLATEVLGALNPRVKAESVAPNAPPRRYWGTGSGDVEATALAAFAYARSAPDDALLSGAVEWLLTHRVGSGWLPHKADGAALAALGRYHGRARQAEDSYRLTISVNDEPVFEQAVTGAAIGQAIDVPRSALKVGGENRVRFDIEGRGTFGYAVTMTGFTDEFGPDQDHANRSFLVTQSIFMPAEPVFEGRTLPTGFGVAVGAEYFENWAHQVEPGGRVRVRVDARRIIPVGQPSWERDFLALECNLPAGTTFIEGSAQTTAAHHELVDGVLTFYFAPDQDPGNTYFDVYGHLPGKYRVLPPRLSSAYNPGRRHMASAGVFDLEVLGPGEPKTDEYRPTPDELYARGKALFDVGRLAEAAGPLQTLWDGYALNDATAREAARMLLFASIETYTPERIVQFFEVLKEKYPELVVPFDKVLIVGRAYRDIGEFERAYLVWRGIVEASYLEDARLGEMLRQRNRPLEAVALLLDLWRDYPNTESIRGDLFGLSQLLASLATGAFEDTLLLRALADAEATRADLVLQAIRLVQVFLSQAPASPIADEASLALVGNFLELEDFETVVKLAARFATVYPRSRFLDSFQYSEALGRFHLGEYDRAIEIAKAIAAAVYPDADGVAQPSPNKWQAIYIIGQIHDARRQAAEAVEYYRQVADQFTDASEAVRFLSQKELSLPEVTVIRPPARPNVAAAGLRNLPVDGMVDSESANRVVLSHRNIGEADVKVYPVDLMRLYLTRRNLDGIAGIDLAGITPLLEKTVALDGGLSYDRKTTTLELPLPREGAYLVMIRGDDLYASGIVLVTPLEMDVREESETGRVRVRVTDSRTGEPLAKVSVKVIGSADQSFHSGETDLRGIYTVEGVTGEVTVLTRQDDAGRRDAPRYAFHRGKVYLGAARREDQSRESRDMPQADEPTSAPAEADAYGTPSLEQNLKLLNRGNQMEQLQRLEQRFQAAPESGVYIQGIK